MTNNPVFRVEEFGDSFVIYFQTDEKRINAYTLASALVKFADAAREANRIINPGYDIEVVVEALASGSFRTKVSAVYREAGNLFSKENIRAVILSLIASFIWEKIHTPSQPTNVIIQTDEVIIERGAERIVVPRNVYVASQQAALIQHSEALSLTLRQV